MERCSNSTNTSHEHLDYDALRDYMVLDFPQKTAIAVLCSLLGMLCVLENAIVLFLILSSPRLRRKSSYLFISSLAGADFLASLVFVISFVKFHVFHQEESKQAFLLKLGGVTMTFTGSVGSLLLTAIDRYLCLSHPAKYKALATRGRALVMLAAMWTMSMVVSYLPLMGWTCCPGLCSELFPLIPNNYLLSWILLIAILLVAIIYTYTYVLWKAYQHSASLVVYQQKRLMGLSRMRLDVRLAKTLGVVLMVLLLCWLPVLTLMVYSLAASLDEHIKKVFAFCSMLCLINSMVNPVIYALRSREIRCSARSCLTRWKNMLRGLGAEGSEDVQKSSVTETEGETKVT
ncbi:cannabinoid receptor 2 [Dromiciops gliroides]|uniref:cannabinoid receptor 2 n=1 Tax=Dromiciops gliroides TaxID=33562 RepID=UPI001CC6FB48|nr:cannabinoid receptor 2 [Dromiciops gliroides]XP_043852979.1 cannabinoid receptor 2 [Dromiciops gliroides]XP_043852980.1 cannabinoid receptor 2 [Dromiciops gliroides]